MLCLVYLICCCSFCGDCSFLEPRIFQISCATFFLCVYRLSKFCLLVDTAACGGKEGLFALWLKNTSRRSGDFSAKRQKNSPAPHVYKSEQARLHMLIRLHNNWSKVSAPVKTSIYITDMPKCLNGSRRYAQSA